MEKAWIECGLLEEKINAPTFPDKTFNILDYGAKADDSLFLNTSSIDQAITACHAAGGGKVLVPDGTFYTGPVTLKSNVNLHIEKGGILKFSTDTSLYLPAVFTRWEGVDCYNLRPLIYAYGESNIALTGKGTIDGQASNENWWWMNGNKNYGWTEGMLSQKTEGRPKLLGFEQNKVPLEERVLTAQDLLRPQLINFYDCKNILLEDLTLTNSPFWVIHPLFCENMTVRSVQIISHGPNSDGCDPESSRNILIQDCLFDTGDDCIAIKSTRNNDGRTSFNKPSENIIVRGCKMKDGHGGVVVGSEISGGFRNLFVEDCFMDSPHLDRVIRIKTNTCRGGVIENIYVRNIEVGECKEAVLKINLQYEPREDCQRDFPPVVRNVYLDNITSGKSQYGVFIVGLDDLENVYNIEVSNSRFNNVEKGNSITGAHDVVLDEVYINEMDARDL
ncbi:MAG: glycoside hydrolase family 28 protein [Candidatus Azobacteroides sp.]|nr:glycoside hydrolase family 28 protein [Candidatus Azobacteroides sp.]